MANTTEKDIRRETLTEFSAAVDEHYGKAMGLIDTVRTLAAARTDIARLEARRKEIGAVRDQRFKQGTTIVRTGRGDGVYLYTSSTTSARKKAVGSAAAKKADQALWLQARTWKPFVRAAAPSGVVLPLGTYKLPPVPTRQHDMAMVLSFYGAPCFDVLSDLRERERTAVARLHQLRAQTDWDGAPITFADGWEIGLHRLQYDDEKLRQIAPELWERLAVMTGGTVSTRVRTMDLSLAIERGYVDEPEWAD